MFSWGDQDVLFVAEIKNRSAPRQVNEALRELQGRCDRSRNENALLALPYISCSVAVLLEETGLSGIDLSGNCVLQTDDFIAIRINRENKYNRISDALDDLG